MRREHERLVDDVIGLIEVTEEKLPQAPLLRVTA
jgi:hypothetical protein